MKTISPLTKPLIVHGRMMYDDYSGAYAIIRFKRRVLDFFSQLYSDEEWMYQLEYWHDYKTAEDRIKEANAKGEGIPILLFIQKSKDANR